MSGSQALLCFTTLPDQAAADKLAESLVAERLAACVSILAPCRSVYRWQGAIHKDNEIPLLIKTTADRYAELERHLRQNHPYELPELIAVEITQGLPAYLDWLTAQI
ncbi:periplasmic divalent cation tolerance protein [Sulfuritortus calidifontis]|uniref:Periplasmic divalent cation tolerance protein n=1 Tax=Sulfuritortus calidifontis TaxID=1914471 RepID=A0A4R3K0C7_9PROT|nr:divalent-cation tolerance protein CutA [Sulfuritortus calidifontis]TCS73321.1 periplasmic divalent cation tolerance protein [Sulfuritortus calidifontis]